jgi:hypothetical protein
MLMVPRSRYKPRAAKKDDRDFSQQFCAAIQRWLLRDRAHTAHWRHQEVDRLQQAGVHIERTMSGEFLKRLISLDIYDTWVNVLYVTTLFLPYPGSRKSKEDPAFGLSFD